MIHEKKDRRFRRTQKQLINALIELLKSKNINQISVREISELADINRATFYLHYKTVNDLLFHLENEVFDEIISSYKDHDILNQCDFLLNLYRCVIQYNELLVVLLNSNTGSTLWDKLSHSIKTQYNLLWSSHLKYLSTRELEYYSAFIIDGYISTIKVWLLNGMKESPEEMVELSRRFQYKILPKT
ncbi:TetR/AcrR family transcriptional regulator [Clostridium sp. C2-6-12]|uniref:TetR/AcrR family transcriptional regulator n=1 Tax=Clostridium sp. C2-6-12 TaxID=2698832 RepID=UPI00136947A8|nr:TetR/AcrR family transcriptional regulator [Clostridium sp. C2-6-12]